ncbi:MAG: permease-like cell division protein FtsX [Candidatus Pacebacteria bacterium]|nr:permease-like cell division protein FtsX [Candidatus Paceibacterota bacterium]
MFLFLFRILKLSFQDIFRNIWLSIVTVTILILALFSINSLITVQVISQNAIEAVKEKIDINLYLTNTASEEQILSLKSQLEELEQVKNVNYISKQEALLSFREKNEKNPEIIQALRELGKNPLSPTLVIMPSSSEQAPELINILRGYQSNIIESRDFTDNSIILEKINNITDKVNQVGMVIIIVFVVTSLIVVYNSIRVAIYTHRREINIMRLVGASGSFIYMPFIVSAIIYSIFSMGVIVAAFYPFLSLLQPYLEVFFVGYNIDIIGYFFSNFWQIFGLELLLVILVNVLASLVAVRRYAKI